VPGFSGWGAPILGSLNYWGGIKDVPNLLLSKGYTVIVSSIAPLSSNWERSCELYQQLTCGKYVDRQDLRYRLLITSDLDLYFPTMMKMLSEANMTWKLITATISVATQVKDPSKLKPRAENGRSYSQVTQRNTTGRGPKTTRPTSSAIPREEQPLDCSSVLWLTEMIDKRHTSVNNEVEITG